MTQPTFNPPVDDDEVEDDDPCGICGHVPCDCDDQYDRWKDWQL